MTEKHVKKFLEEVQKHSDKSFSIGIHELRTKAVTILEAFIVKNLKIKNARSYSLVFLTNSRPIELYSLHQVKCALTMLLDLINEGEYLELPHSKEVHSEMYYSKAKKEIRKSFVVFEELFSKYPGQIDAIIKDLNMYATILSEEGLKEQLTLFDRDLEKELEFLEILLDDVLTWDDFELYYGKEGDVMVATLERLIASRIAKRELVGITDKIKRNFEDENSHLDIFSPNGFRLFDYLIKNHISLGIGLQSDVSFFYRMMKERDKLIHVNQKRFREFLEENYTYLEPVGKFKVWNDINTQKRRQAYLAAKSAMRLK